MYIGLSNIAILNARLLVNYFVFLIIQDGVQDGCQYMGRFEKLCNFFTLLSIFFSNTSFQLVLWSLSPSKLLPDNVKQYLAPQHEGFKFWRHKTA